MKKLLLTAIAVGAGLSAMAQGTIQFANSPFSLINTNNSQGSARGRASSSLNLNVGLIWSTTSNATATTYGGLNGAAALLLSGTLSTPVAQIGAATPGVLPANSNYLVPGTQPSDSDWFQVVAWDSTFGNTLAGLNAAMTAGSWFGASNIRQFALGPNSGPGTPIFGSGATFIQAFDVTQSVPEPTTIALGGLGAAALLFFRRKK